MTEACVACGEPNTADRCEHCGAARNPGGYRVRRLVAQTPHSRLYAADAPDGRPVALKELWFHLVPGVTELEAFEREGRLLAELDHPRIPRFIATFKEGKGVGTRLYLAQEFVQGESLADRLKNRRFSEAEARDVAGQVLMLLVFLHGRTPTLLHRDVKPANILRRPDGTLVLVDFGSARTLANEATHRSTLVGTYGYMPPEQLGGTVDATSDIYALGATLVHLVSGKSPSDLVAPGLDLDVAKHVQASPEFVAWLARATARSRADRFPSASAALEALEKKPAPLVAAPKPRVSSAPYLVVAIIATIALSALIAVSMRKPPPAPLPVEIPAAEAVPEPEPEAPPAREPNGVATPVEPRAPRPKPDTPAIPGIDVIRSPKRVAADPEAFFVRDPIRIERSATVTVPHEARCKADPTVTVTGFEVRPPTREKAAWRVSVSFDGMQAECPEIRWRASDADGTAGAGMVSAEKPVAEFLVAPTVSKVELRFGPPSKAVGVALEASHGGSVTLLK